MKGKSFSLPVGAIQDFYENAFHLFLPEIGMFGWKCLDYSSG
jgi:hypothetical protein